MLTHSLVPPAASRDSKPMVPSLFETVLNYLFTPRKHHTPTNRSVHALAFPFEFIDGIVLALYTAVLSWDIYHHRPWIDEAQAWLIARDASLHELLLRRLHYEGAPALWHLILKCLVELHLPYAAMNWLGGAFALIGMYVFLRFSPFPRIFRWLLPFTFYLQYQYAVIARPYVLFPLLMFLLCIVYSLAKPRPVLFALIAGLLANINAHAAIMSCLFAALYLWELYRKRDSTAPEIKRQVAVAACLFVSLCMLSVAVAFPAPDAMVVPSATGHMRPANPVLLRLLPPETMPASAPPLDPPLDETASSGNVAAVPATASSLPPTLLQRIRARIKVKETARLTGDVATFPISESNTLSVLFLLSFGAWLWSRKSLKLALPWLITVPVAAKIWIYDHHTGMFAVALIAVAWITLKTSSNLPSRTPKLEPASAAFSAVALLVVLLQIGWTAHQFRMETHHPYDAGKETEAFLASNDAGKRIAGFGFQSVSLQPYATHNLFFNQDHTYWLWSNVNPIDLRRTEALQQHPDAVVIADLIADQDSLYNQWGQTGPSGQHVYAGMIKFWTDNGYHETHRFCGYRYMRAGTDNTLCELIFEPDAKHSD